MRGSLFLFVIGALVTFPAQPLKAATKIDPLFRSVEKTARSSPLLAKSIGVKSDGLKLLIPALVKSSDIHQTQFEVESRGGEVRSIVGDILSLLLPLDELEALSDSPSIIYIEAAKPIQTKLNLAHSLTGVSDVHSGEGVTAEDGSGVIIGIVDTGIDCDHADFQDAGGNNRILAYWNEASSATTGVSEITNSSGKEYVGTDLVTGGGCITGAPDSDSSTPAHGTHIAGIAAGSNATYKGVAPGANLVVVLQSSSDADSGGTFSTSVINGIDYIFKKANALNRPAVANLSLGTSLGAHDGTSLFESGLDNLLKESDSVEKSGRSIVCAAGNENLHGTAIGADEFGGIHAAVSASSAAGVGYEFRGRDSRAFSIFGGIIVDIWLDADSDCTIEVDGFNNSTRTQLIDMSPVSAGGSSTATATGVTIALDFTDSDNALNGKQHAHAVITTTSTANAMLMAFDLVFKGSCTGNAWLYPDVVALTAFTKDQDGEMADGGYTFVAGDSDMTMTVPCTATDVISTTSFAARNSYTDVNGNVQSQTSVTNASATDISTFASLGPTADGRIKPDIAAPGEPIISTLASTASVSSSKMGDATHHKLEGTSMASPYVAGVVALMLQKNGCLTASEIKSAIQTTASSDSFTGDADALPGNAWGHGKVDAKAAVNAITASDCVPSNTSEIVTTINTKTSSCSLVRDNLRQSVWSLGIIFIFGLILLRFHCGNSPPL